MALGVSEVCPVDLACCGRVGGVVLWRGTAAVGRRGKCVSVRDGVACGGRGLSGVFGLLRWGRRMVQWRGRPLFAVAGVSVALWRDVRGEMARGRYSARWERCIRCVWLVAAG